MPKKPKDERAILQDTTGGKIKRFSRYAQVRAEFDMWAARIVDDQTAYDEFHEICTTNIRLADKVLEEIDREDVVVIDFGCGTGLSGQPFLDRGHIIDGIEFAPGMIKAARKRGYDRVYNRNLVTDPLRLRQRYDIAISVGVCGDWIPYYLLVPKMIKALKQRAALGFTSDVPATDKAKLEKLIQQNGFKILNFDKEKGPEGDNLKHTYYYFVVAKRE
jgi:predicted TPR repeat methyltransferase